MEKLKGRPGTMKEINRKQVLNLIREKAPVSRSELAAALGMSLPTVMRAVDGLIEERYVTETGKGDSAGGRRPVLLELNRQDHYVIGVDISRWTTVILLNLAGETEARMRRMTGGGEGPEAILDSAADMIRSLLRERGLSASQIDGIGIGVPGSQFKSGELISESFYRGWEAVDIEALVTGKLGIPATVENIAKAFALGELYLGEARGGGSFIKVMVDSGVGCGIVLNGSLYKGADAVAGEFGHSVIELDGEPCYCGNRGCLEMYVSIPAILKRLKRRISESGPSPVLRELLQENPEPDFQQMVGAMEKGDPLTIEVLTQSGRILGIGLANLVNLYNPERIVLDGEVSRKCPPFVEAAQESAREHIFSRKAQSTAITVSTLGEDSGALGAASTALTGIFGMRYAQ